MPTGSPDAARAGGAADRLMSIASPASTYAVARGDDVAAPRPLLITLLMLLLDTGLVQVAVAAAILVRLALAHWVPIGIGFETWSQMALVMLVLPIGYFFAGLYPGYGRTGVERLRVRVLVTVLGFGGLILFDYLAQNGQWSRGILLITAAIVVVAVPVWDAMVRHWLMRTRWWGEPAVVWGPAERRQTVIATLNLQRDLGWLPVSEGEFPVPGMSPLPGIKLAILVLDRQAALPPLTVEALPYSRVVLVPDMGNVQSLWVAVRDLDTHLGLEMQRNLLVPGNRILKRCLDLLLGAVAAALALPIVLAAAAAIKFMSPGPVFFAQTREGHRGVPFRMWKLRTMVTDADRRLEALFAASPDHRVEWEQNMKLRDDPRIIPRIGHFLRRFSVDELPQLWNVLRGEMSLIGPRPLPDYHLAALDRDGTDLRRHVRPGMTGLSQVSGRSSCSLEEQQHLDGYYVRNWSLWLDLYILARTVLAVVRGRGAW